MKCLMPLALDHDLFYMTINDIEYVPMFDRKEDLDFYIKSTNTLSAETIVIDSEEADDLIILCLKHGRKVAIVRFIDKEHIEYQELVL